MLKGKHIILGISGGIAAYKSVSLLRLFVKAGADVQVVITPSGKEFITPVTLSALSGRPVISEFFTANTGSWNSHVDLGLWADAMVIAPATASTIAKMANGVADNMLITTYLSAKSPVFVAPAMDLDMFAHPSTRRNIDLLRSYGNHIIDSPAGELASHLVGKGRMEEPERIFEVVDAFFDKEQDLKGRKVMITAGPTYEKIDPVRFISNHSTGKMGYAIARQAMLRGADVTLVTGKVAITPPEFVTVVPVTSAQDMYEAVTAASADQDIIIKAAAVADYKPAEVSDNKIKKSDADMSIPLTRTKDILAFLGMQREEARKTDGDSRLARQIICGFSMETQNLLENSRKKLEKKKIDIVAANNLKTAGAGFGTDTNVLTLITQDEDIELPQMSKEECADRLLTQLIKMRK